jgi:polyisoprenyl-phosphate glycosyltransferase
MHNVRPTLSLVLPVLNEADVLPSLHQELLSFLGRIGLSSEVIFVDSCSNDGSTDRLKSIVQGDARFHLVCLSRNFGHAAALSAGLEFARGHAVIVMDADLQDPFEVISEMINLWKQGNDVVYGKPRAPEGATPLARLASAIASKLTKASFPSDVPLETGDFRLTSRRVVLALRELKEAHRFVRGMVAWIGFRQAEVLYTRAPRAAGASKVSSLGRIAVAANNVFALSTLPLRFATKAGFVMGLLSLLAGLWALIAHLFSGTAPGWSSTFTLIAFVASIQLFLGGLIGEYVARVYEAIKARPTYLAQELVNLHARDTSEEDSALPAELSAFNSIVPAAPANMAAPLAHAPEPQAQAPWQEAPAATRPTEIGFPAMSYAQQAHDFPSPIDIPPPTEIASVPDVPPSRAALESADIIDLGAPPPAQARPSSPPPFRGKTPAPPPASDVTRPSTASKSARPSGGGSPGAAPPRIATNASIEKTQTLSRPRHATVVGIAPPPSVSAEAHTSPTSPPPREEKPTLDPDGTEEVQAREQ